MGEPEPLLGGTPCWTSHGTPAIVDPEITVPGWIILLASEEEDGSRSGFMLRRRPRVAQPEERAAWEAAAHPSTRTRADWSVVVLLPLLDAPVVFGLTPQKREQVRALLAQGKDWPEIGRIVSWEPVTLRAHYERESRLIGESA